MARVLVNTRKKLIGGISIPTTSRSATSYRRCFATSAYTTWDGRQGTTPISPIRPPWHVGNFMRRPHLHPEIFDKIRDESLQAICCFHGSLGYGYKHAYVIIQKLLEQYPHVHTFHFLMGLDIETHEHDEDEMRESNIARVPMFHFYQNGKKVVELDGNYIIRFKKVLQKLYKPFFTSAHNCQSNQQSSRDSTFDKIQGRANFELILSEEYNLGANRIGDAAVVCFATYSEYASYFVYSLLHNTFSGRFPHVKIYYVLLAPKEDDYETALENFDISPVAHVPTIRFFKDGKMLAVVASSLGNCDRYCTVIEDIFEEFYNAQELQNKDGGVRGQQGRKVKKELNCSVPLEDIVQDAGIVHIGDVDMNSDGGPQFGGIVETSPPQSPSAPNEGNKKQMIWMTWEQISDRCQKLWQ